MRLPYRIMTSTGSIAGILAVTYVASGVLGVNATTVGFVYLLFVLLAATTWGFLEAGLSSIVATIAFNFFFLPPVGTLTITDPQNWIALFSFLATALIASRLSTRARNQALDALQRQRDVERLYAFGRAILLIGEGEPFAKQLITRLADIFELNAAALYESRTGEIFRAGPDDSEAMDNELKLAASQGAVFTDSEHKRVVTAVRLGSEPIAGIAMQGAHMSDSVAQSLANLVAIGLERLRAQNLEREVEVSRRSERLRTTLIDAVAHEFKTPLTAIRAATTGLVSGMDGIPSGAMRLLKIADEEAAHLDELIDNALDIAQLESDQLDVDLEAADLNAFVREVVASMSTKLGERRVELELDKTLPEVAFDRRLVRLAMKQIMDNAIKYSPAATAVHIRSLRIEGNVAIEIIDQGKGIPRQEQQRIFERFYRGPSVQNHIPGSGLGLSIAQRILHAHGGDVMVESCPGETIFRLILPLGARQERIPRTGVSA